MFLMTNTFNITTLWGSLQTIHLNLLPINSQTPLSYPNQRRDDSYMFNIEIYSKSFLKQNHNPNVLHLICLCFMNVN